MNYFKTIFVFVAVVLSSGFIAGTQEDPITITATYNGYVSDTYSFTYTDEEGEEDTIFFDYMDESTSEEFDLTTEKFKGKKFEVTYKETTEIEEDEEGEELEYTKRTIISLKLKS